MSLILDALRKLDRERTAGANDPANIAVEILRPDLPRPGRKIQLYFAAIFLTAILTAAVTYGVMRGGGLWPKSPSPAAVISPAPSRQAAPPPPAVDRPPKSSSPAPVVSPSQHRRLAPAAPQAAPLQGTSPPVSINPLSPPQQDTPGPPEVASVSKSSPPPPVISPVPPHQAAPPSPAGEPAGGAREEIGRIPPKPQDPAENRSSTRFPGEQKENQNVISKEAEIGPGNTRKPAEPSPNRSDTAPPALKLTVIAWHEESSERFAFVNGVKTYEGGFINGVKIVQIYPNRVRFLHNGRHFEISAD